MILSVLWIRNSVGFRILQDHLANVDPAAISPALLKMVFPIKQTTRMPATRIR